MNNKKKVISALLIIALVVIAVTTFINKQLDRNKNTLDDNIPGYEVKFDSPQSVGLGKPAPDFTLKTLDGNTMTLSDLKGKKSF